ncbi:DUF29 domain-containing protein [Paraburkholderia phenazinium]|uniref:DUF29 domain-containing protein n=1 Tax=Paraburkholderia phenazinium TaxID=60549 RepID=A0A1N6FIA1_9BURK|nr:DUF29 domain-containing protein [Paraburkholderia phenazinium]SIN94982.1 protein of unknown function DUF29 [Paraburkholderia phenazinium]
MPAYDEDVYAWAFEQARFLREGRFDLLDIEHLADEIENVAKEEVRELIKRMSVLLASLLKWSYLPAERSSSRSARIEAQRLDVADILDDSPSLRAVIDEPGSAQSIWADTLAHAAAGISSDSLPSESPWASNEVLSEGWLPPDISKLRQVDLRTFGLHIDATYIRVGGQGGKSIRYGRINVGRRTNGLKNTVRARIARMAFVICLLAPDLADTILSMPAGPLGRLVKVEVRRARPLKHSRGLVKRRPVSTVFRVPEISAEG